MLTVFFLPPRILGYPICGR